MKRKSAEQAILTAIIDDLTVDDDHFAEPQFSKKQKNLRSKFPRRKRAHISPIIINFSSNSSKPAPSLSPSVTSNFDEISCNTTLESVVLPQQNAPFQSKNDVISKPAVKGAVEVSVSENSCVESCSVVLAAEAESKLLQNNKNAVVEQNSPSTTTTVDQKPAKISDDELIEIIVSDLACSEDFSSYDDYEVTSASDIFSGENFSEFEEFTDEYTPSIWLNSGSEFSEKSFNDESPSPCFSLFKEFHRQFLKLSSVNCDYKVSSFLDDEYSDELAYWRFENEEDEESYSKLRRRERSQAAKMKDYVQEYDFATDYGELIGEQRLLMANWIIEISRKKDLQHETMFLGLRLFDRFLSNGFFTSRRNLQLLGIACLTLAIRIEENQPYNCVRQKAFYVGSNVYSRTEVVAMEWVVQEVLKFQCLSPTIYNFLWFYLQAAEANEEMRRRARYLAGLALLDHRQLQFWPSTVAAGVVILVSLSTDHDESCQRVVQAHVRTKIDDLPECIKSLEWLVKYAL